MRIRTADRLPRLRERLANPGYRTSRSAFSGGPIGYPRWEGVSERIAVDGRRGRRDRPAEGQEDRVPGRRRVRAGGAHGAVEGRGTGGRPAGARLARTGRDLL